MNIRFHQTALAIGLALAWAGSAHAQLLIVDHQVEPVKQTASASSLPASAPTSSPAPGLLIVEGYDRTPVAPSVTAPSAPAANDGSVVEVGVRPISVETRQGWANGVPVATALQQVIPTDFSLRSVGINAKTLVSWSGGRPWPETLATVARNGHLHAAILWRDKVVTVVPNTRSAITSVGVTTSVPTSVAAAPIVQTWTLDPALSLHENVALWVKKAGWNNLVWEGADYPIYGPATFTGRFDAPDGPLASLIKGYAQSRQPLLVKLTTMDKVVHVYNRGYHPTEVQSESAAELAPDLVTHANVGVVNPAATPDAIRTGSSLAPININDRTTSVRHH